MMAFRVSSDNLNFSQLKCSMKADLLKDLAIKIIKLIPGT